VTTPTIRVSDLSLRYGRTHALNGVTFALDRGVTGFLGPNGAGKTTLLRILATAIAPDSGRLSVLDEDPLTARGRLRVRRRLGFLPQEPGFHRNFTAFEFVDYVAILKELVGRRERHREVRRVLAATGLDAVRGKKIKALSGGMRQRTALAAALVGDPDLLILDEPTVGLDPEQQLRFRELIAGLGEGRTVLLSTHRTEDVTAACQRVIVLDRGEIRFDGRPAELAGIASGRVWDSDSRAPGALAAWRTADGSYRNVGNPPDGAQLVPPALEDGYLLLVDPGAATVGSAA
jgi:ABC-2 type transport system ATP-binding protein